MYRNDTNARPSRWGSGANSPQEGGARMKTRIWALGLVLMMALLVGANATTAQAASFSFTWGGCDGDTLCLYPVLGGIPDSVEFYVTGAAPGWDLISRDVAAPFDTCLVGFVAPALRDSIHMIAYFTPDPDTTISRPNFLSNIIVAMGDGVTVQENGTIAVQVIMNDTTSTPDSSWLESEVLGNISDHGTIDSIQDNTWIWYTPNPGYNGTDDFAYRHNNGCGDNDTAVVNLTIQSDGLISFDSCWYELIHADCNPDCSGDCDEATNGTISIGDSIRFCAAISAWDLDELTAGWPRVDLPGLAGTNLTMIRDTSIDLGLLDSTIFCWPGRTIDSANTWYVVDEGNLDLVQAQYEAIFRARSNVVPNQIAACTTLVDEAIDNMGPEIGAGVASWTLWQDVDGNGIVTTVDTMRLFIDLRNEPFEEICAVSATLYGFPTTADTGVLANTYCLYEIAGDNRWALVLTGADLAGDLEDVDGPFTAVFHYWDNACNEDSTDTQYNGPVDNTAPDCNCIEWVYEAVDDLDENGCIGLGESVRIEARDTCNGDVEDFYVDLFSDTTWRLGLGSSDPADSSHRRFLLPSIGGGWYGVEWVLGQYPLENAIDTTAAENVVPWVFLHAEDDAGNPLTCDSLQMNWTDLGINIDARAPNPVVIDSCVEAETFTGRRAVHIYFTDTANGPGFQDIARFRMFYDNGTGVIDYVDTLAGLNWDDTLGGTGTDGLVRVGPNSFYWTTDGTVELSECRDYLFNIWVRDDCDNLETSHPDSILCVGERPDPVVDLDCSPEDDLNICLEWTTYETSADSFHIYMATDGICDTAVWVASVPFTDTGITYEWCTDDAGLELIEFRWYDFIVLTFDSCGNVQDEYPKDCENGEYSYVTRCFADLAPPVVCIFQPASLSADADTTIYSCDHCGEFLPGSESDGMYIYTRPCNDTSLDVRQIDTVLVRIADSAGTPGEWRVVSFDSWEGPNHWAIKIYCEGLDALVREDDSVEVLQVMVISTDAAGRTSTRDQVEDCCGFFEFVWSAYEVKIIATTVDGNVQTYQPYCNAHGFDVSGGGVHEVEVCITGGTAPFKIRASAAPSGEQWADENYHQVVYVENVYARCTTLSFSTEGWEKGLGELDVEVCDAAGHYDGENEIALCVDDDIPPCALITNPVDGKCIRRSISMVDPVNICMTIDPAGIGLDNENILKVDFQWSQDCCTGFVVDTICFDTACPPPVGFPDGSVCTTFANPNNPFFGTSRCYPTVGNPVACTVYAATNNLDSTICWEAQADTTCKITVCRLREVPCETVFEWKTFAIVPGSYEGDWQNVCVDWWNTEDLAWVTESGTIIYLRGVVYDEQGNVCLTPCVQVCVDIDTPPLCLWTPDVCPSNGYTAIGGNDEHKVTFVAELDLAQGNVDDLEDVTLWYKKSTDPDLLAYWTNVGSGFFGNYATPGGTNSTVWRWDLDIDDLGLQDGISYDWRAIGHTIWGTTSWDYTGDGNFDANTFDSSGCDMNTYYIDITAPQVAMDTVWTTVNGELIVQPNVSCALSDPRGWAWTQFGNDLTVQPSVYPWTGQGPEYLNFKDDVKRVRWTLFDNSHTCECSESRGEGAYPSGSCFDDECDCPNKGDGQICDYDGSSNKSGNGQEWVVADYGTTPGQNPMQNLTFNPADAPWWDENWTGVQTAVLLVEVWDSCGNRTQDCITLYLLDADPTDAIIVEPMNDEVFCTAPGGEAYGGIEIRSGSILEEGWNKAVYAYRAVGSSDWIEFDSVGISQDGDYTWQKGWTEVTWNPVALGLLNGSYELTVWAVDNALNRSTNLYIVTVHLSCSAPTVALVYPTSTDPAFVGCPIQLEAVATSDDPVNPITEVEFYYVSVIEALDEANYIGSDYNSVDGRWGYFWDEPNFEGPHYIFAIAYNLSGQSSTSELVWVKGDDTSPWAVITQVGDDITNSDDDDSDPTPIQHGSTVTLYGNAYDNQADWGYGEVDNCGVDSVIFYVYDYNYNRVAGFLATPDNIIDSLFTAEWAVLGDFPAGEYHIQMSVWDCACNNGTSDYWDVEIISPDQNPTISVSGPEICGYVSVDDTMSVTVTVNNPEFVDEVWVAFSNSIYSDVEGQYTWYELNNNNDGTWSYSVDVSGYDEGLYRVRAVIQYTDGSWTENGFDDFTFNDEFGHHMLVRFDHSVTPMTISPVGGGTFKAHNDICFTVDAVEECDIDQLFICAGEDASLNEATDPLSFCFDPVDSSCVTLSNCGVWGGEISFLVTDALGHSEVVGSQVWILEVAGPDTTLITSPTFGSFITPTSNNVLTARKLSTSGVDSVQFFRSVAQTNGGTYIGSAVASGDEFTYEWNVGSVEGNFYIYTRSFNNNVGKDGPRCVNVTVTAGCEALALTAPNPNHQRTVNGQTITFVGDRVDLCIDTTAINATAGMDSIVWNFRGADAPGIVIEDNLDPNLGWVRIDTDVYGSLCVDWFTDWCQVISDFNLQGEYGYEGNCCSDGRYTVVAWVYDKAGNVCHSVPMNVVVDGSDPYSEIVDIDGDETFGTCHEVILPSDSVVKFTANAIDDHSCTGLDPYQAWNSGAKYLQFFVGECGGGGGCVDIVFVQDGSGSMGDEQEAIATNATLFANALGSIDFRLGVLGYDGNYEVIGTDGSRTEAAPGNGVFTTDISTFQTMITTVGDEMGGTENGLTALNTALTAYPWRSNCTKVLILVTDEDADDFADYASLFPPIVNSGAAVFGVIAYDDSVGYSNLGTATGGDLFDITANWGANLAALASQITSLAGGGANDVGIVWGKQVVLNDGQSNAFALWNPTGLEPGTYCAWTVVIDNVGNMYTSSAREICIIDQTPPVAMITGFGKSTDEHMVNKYTIYGATWDSDVDYVQFQYRQTGSTSATDWTGIGISSTVNGDSTCWMTTWNPCVLSGSFDLRVVPTDKNGNQDFEVQPIATVTISNCAITPSGNSTSAATIWFEDRTFDDLGLVHVDQDNTSDDYHNMMLAVWADLTGDLTAEKIDLWAPDPDLPSWKSGAFSGSDAIKLGGEGWFWQSYTDASNRTHLKREVMTVWPVKAAIGGCNSTHPTLGAKVCIDAGALSADNGIVVFPARVPVVNWSQQHYQAWPAHAGTRFPLVTAIRLTTPLEGTFNTGKYAKVTVKYRNQAALDNSDLTVGWWDGDQWNIEDGLLAASGIDDSSGSVFTTDLHGLYAIVSAGRTCVPGALTVENAGMEKAVGNITGPWPTIYTRVRSNIEFNNRNTDLDEDNMTVVLDGNITLMADGDEADNGWYDVDWDEVTGILTVNWNGPEECLTDDDYSDYGDDGGDSYEGAFAPALTSGTHTLYVRAFNDAGYCAENTFTFTVDRSSPNVEVVGYEDCANPTFHIKITDEGPAGVDWENVFVDVFDITGSEFDALPKSRLIHTETYDAFNEELDLETGEFSFQLISHIAQGRRLRIVIYIGDRYVYFDNNCSCEYVEYDHDCDGVQDLVGNRTQIVEEQYTIWGTNCSGDGDGGGIDTVVVSSGSNNPFDPWNGQTISFDLQGFCEGGSARAEVFDVAGVKVRDLTTGGFQNPVSQVEWNGTNQDEEYVAQGVYLVHFTCTGGSAGGSRSQVIKVVVKRGSGTASN